MRIYAAIFLRLFTRSSFFIIKLFAGNEKALTFAVSFNRNKRVMNLHTSINLAVLHIIRVVVVTSRA